MHVNPRDGWCHSCGGTLRIIDADDVTLTVECMAEEEQTEPPSAA